VSVYQLLHQVSFRLSVTLQFKFQYLIINLIGFI
jgi:hypothetical protein